MKKIAMIPVRAGSTRLKRKNYLELDGKPIFVKIVELAIQSKCFDEIVINSEDISIKEIANNLNVQFYHRDKKLATSHATSDQVVYDFIINNMQEYSDDSSVFWINTASPLTLIDDVTSSVNDFVKSSKKSFVSIRKTRGHLLYNETPLNFEYDESFARTQDMKSAKEYTYAIMAWKKKALVALKNGQMFNDHTLTKELSLWSSILLKNEDDFKFIKSIADGRFND